MTALVLAILLVALGPGEVPAVAGEALLDQHGASDSLEAHRGETVVVLVVTARRLRNLKPWERDLREAYEDLVFLRVYDGGRREE